MWNASHPICSTCTSTKAEGSFKNTSRIPDFKVAHLPLALRTKSELLFLGVHGPLTGPHLAWPPHEVQATLFSFLLLQWQASLPKPSLCLYLTGPPTVTHHHSSKRFLSFPQAETIIQDTLANQMMDAHAPMFAAAPSMWSWILPW